MLSSAVWTPKRLQGVQKEDLNNQWDRVFSRVLFAKF